MKSRRKQQVEFPSRERQQENRCDDEDGDEGSEDKSEDDGSTGTGSERRKKKG
jgi:hypothetical protein